MNYEKAIDEILKGNKNCVCSFKICERGHLYWFTMS